MKKAIPIVLGLVVALLILLTAKCAVDGLDEQSELAAAGRGAS